MRHPTKAVVAYASGEKIRNISALQKHLSGCEICRDRVAFMQRFVGTLEAEGAREREREHSGPEQERRRIRSALEQPEISAKMKRLTDMEIQVVSGVIQGMKNNEIAKQIGVSQQVVKHSLASVFNKIGIAGRSELAVFAKSLSAAELKFLHLTT